MITSFRIRIIMKTIVCLISYFLSLSTAFSFNTYDLGFQGFYPTQHFRSVDLEPPATQFTRWDSRCDPGHLYITPRGPFVSGAARGPVILDSKGELVWMDNKKWPEAMNFNVQTFNGEQYLTFWIKDKNLKDGKKDKKKEKKDKGERKENEDKGERKEKKDKEKKKGEKNHGIGKKTKSKKSFVMLDSSYNVKYQFTPKGKHLKADSHEFRITPQGTALVAIYHKVQTDCTDLNLGKSCWIRDGWFQELDLETGDLLFEWHATDHISMKDVFSEPCSKDGYGRNKDDAFDFFHLNAIDKTDAGDYLVSARYMHAILCVSGKTGEILWQLGGKKNNFTSPNEALDFAWQHHVTWQGNNTISLFDNHANSVLHKPSSHSKGMIIQLDLKNMTATLVQKYVHPNKILNVSQGSVQVIPESGNVLVGFGNSPTYVEYTATGEVLCSAHYAPHINYELVDFGMVKSYRVFKSPWVGRPDTIPDVKARKGKAYVSWNGATEVKYWRLETAKKRDDEFVTVHELEKSGFETAFEPDREKMSKYLRFVALDADGETMAFSEVVKTPSRGVRAIFWLFLIMGFVGGLSIIRYRRRLMQVVRTLSRKTRSVSLGRDEEQAETRLLRGGPQQRFGRSTWLSKVLGRTHKGAREERVPLLLNAEL